MRILASMALIISFSPSAQGYVIAYTKLYRKNTDTIVDLIYDCHMPSKEVKAAELHLLGPKLASHKLFPTEQKVLNLIRAWEKKGSECDLIWETAICDYWPPSIWCLLTMASFFKLHKMKSVHFIPADYHRECGFNSLFALYERDTRLCPQNLTGCSFDNPAPLSAKLAEEIEQVSGTATWQDYKSMRKRVVKTVKDYFEPWSREQSKLMCQELYGNFFFYTLCDIEILSHLLASKARRIVVYAGGWHCSNIALFLERNGFEILYSRGETGPNLESKELAVSDLDPLEHREFTTTSSSTFIKIAYDYVQEIVGHIYSYSSCSNAGKTRS